MLKRMRTAVPAALAAGAIAAALAGSAAAASSGFGFGSSGFTRSFSHVGTFNVPANLLPGEDVATVTSAEIVDYALLGTRLLYTDSPLGRLGFVNIVNPSSPQPAGVIDMGGEPTSVAVAGLWALVAVNTSPSFAAPSGDLVVVNVLTKAIVRRIPLAGQPDSVSLSQNEQYAAIVIENERDEDVNDGLIPQLPGGSLQILELKGLPNRWTLRTVDLTGLAAIAPDDPEPEFVDVNSQNEAVVSLQENNHLVVVDLKMAKVLNDFSAGTVTLENVDATEDGLGPQETGLIQLTESITKRREPDAVQWIDNDTFATANEGDYEDENGDEGGARGFTFFNESGAVEWESGSSFEHEVVRAGHYPEARSENKGSEPEGLEVATFGFRKFLFVGSERANVVGVYDVSGGAPQFLHVLPTGIGPEGIKAIPGRNLLAVSAETDGKADGFDIRSIVTLYRFQSGKGSYPQLLSANEGNVPIPWVAISGLAGDPSDRNALWAVSDSFLAQASVYRIDVSNTPAVIQQRIPVGLPDGLLDLEGIAARREGGFWVASEGRVGDRPNAILRLDAAGNVLGTPVELPTDLVAGATSSGFEGVAVTGTEAGGDEIVWVVIQGTWADDPAGFTKIGRYEVTSGTWTFARYQLDPVESPNGGSVGLSEITLLPDGKTAAIVERDNQIALDARIKRIYGVDLTDQDVEWKPFGEELDVVEKRLLRDVLPDLDARSISVPDKLEGVGVTANGQVYLATDNDGVDENYGETLFFRIASLGGRGR